MKNLLVLGSMVFTCAAQADLGMQVQVQGDQAEKIVAKMKEASPEACLASDAMSNVTHCQFEKTNCSIVTGSRGFRGRVLADGYSCSIAI